MIVGGGGARPSFSQTLLFRSPRYPFFTGSSGSLSLVNTLCPNLSKLSCSLSRSDASFGGVGASGGDLRLCSMNERSEDARVDSEAPKRGRRSEAV